MSIVLSDILFLGTLRSHSKQSACAIKETKGNPQEPLANAELAPKHTKISVAHLVRSVGILFMDYKLLCVFLHNLLHNHDV